MEILRNYRKLMREDMNLSCKDMALFLLGKLLVRKLDDDTILKGRIVETECYLGGEDKASHSAGGKRTPRNLPMYMDAGTCYVYMTYGMYYCFNISSIEPGAVVLIRALEPICGMNEMQKFRYDNVHNKGKKLIKEHELCSGPSKLCIALDISKENCNKIDICDNDSLWLEDDPDFVNQFSVIVTSRIGIASAGVEWATKPLRYYILGNKSVSKRDRKLEKELLLPLVDNVLK